MSEQVEKLLHEAKRIIIGISGGADSIALTHILFSRFGAEKLVAAHVNHGIRGEESDRDEAFVRNFCGELGIPLKVEKTDVPAQAKALGMGEETCGRMVRYAFFDTLCRQEDIIATAHNADDHAETVLLNLIRGSGLRGLRGIPQVRGNIVRPILFMSRNEIECYCREQGLAYVQDSSNFENDYARNKLRNLVMPVLREINQGAVRNIGGAAKTALEATAHLDAEVQTLLTRARRPYGLAAAVLADSDDYILGEVLLVYLKECGCREIERVHLLRICKALRSSGGVTLPGEMQVDVRQGMLTVTEKKEASRDDFPVNLGGETHIGGKILVLHREKLEQQLKINNLLFNNSFDCDKIKGILTVGFRREGERFLPAGRNVGKSLKKLFNEKRIPAALRDDVLIVRDENEIVFIEGMGISENHCVQADTRNIYTVEIKRIGDE